MSGEDFREEDVGKEDEHGAVDHAVGRRLADFHAAAFDRVAVEGGDAGDDVGEEERLDDGHPDKPLLEGVLESIGEILGRQYSCETDGVGATETCRHGERDQHGNHGQQPHDLRQDEERGGVDAHDFQGIDLLSDAHGTKLRGYI